MAAPRPRASAPGSSAARQQSKHAGASRPLEGVRVVSIAQNVPGPVALARLVAEGATAIKVEPPAGDPLRTLSLPWYRELHREITVRRLDLKSAAGGARLQGLLAEADLFLASQRPAALSRLGLDADAVARAQPHVRWLNIVGNTDAPELPGHDLTYQAGAGLLGRDLPTTLLADLLGAERVFGAALLLLRHPAPARTQVGLSQALDLLRAPLRFGVTSAEGPLGGGLPAYCLYETKRGRVAVAALEPHFRRKLYAALDLPDGHDLGDQMRTRTAREWEAWARRLDLPLTRVAAAPRPRRGR